MRGLLLVSALLCSGSTCAAGNVEITEGILDLFSSVHGFGTLSLQGNGFSLRTSGFFANAFGVAVSGPTPSTLSLAGGLDSAILYNGQSATRFAGDLFFNGPIFEPAQDLLLPITLSGDLELFADQSSGTPFAQVS